jgi:serine/threonine-protein kinase
MTRTPALGSPSTTAPRISDEGEVARGGMGSIRRVHDLLIGRRVAMKVLHPATGRAPARERELERRVLREAMVVGQLDHPHIVPLYDLGLTAEAAPCFTMKLVDGRTLEEIVAEGDVVADPAKLEQVLHVLLKVCDGIAFAHGRGVVHCDLKPPNIMVGTHGQVYVMDWGIARLLGDDHLARLGIDPARRVRCDDSLAKADSDIAGTPAWMAPEQARGRKEAIDPRTDVFQLGALVYFVLTGRPPYVGEGPVAELLMAREGVVPPPEQVAGRPLPRGLCAVALRAMAAAPDQRFQTVEAFKYDLERCLGRGTFGTRSFPPGAAIVKEHESGDAAYLITRGHCEAFKTEGGRKVPLRRMGPGELFGETAILTDQPRSATVVALDDVTVMTVSRRSFDDGFSVDTWMGVLVRTLATRFRDLDAQLTSMRREQLRLRVRERLLVAIASGRPAIWSKLCAALAAEHGISELDVMAIVAGSDDLAIDAARDLLGLAGR